MRPPLYSRYLKLYPEGEDSQRVSQRLAGVVSIDAAPKEKLRELKSDKSETPWELYGSLFQNYRFNGIESDFSDDDESVSQSSLATGLSLSVRREIDDYEIRGELSTSHTKDFRDAEADDASLYDAYIEVAAQNDSWQGRMGRQRLNSSGILNRFDGAVVEYEVKPDIRMVSTPVFRLRVPATCSSVGTNTFSGPTHPWKELSITGISTCFCLTNVSTVLSIVEPLVVRHASSTTQNHSLDLSIMIFTTMS